MVYTVGFLSGTAPDIIISHVLREFIEKMKLFQIPFPVDQDFSFRPARPEHGIKGCDPGTCGHPDGRSRTTYELPAGFGDPQNVTGVNLCQSGGQIALFDYIEQDPYFLILFPAANAIKSAGAGFLQRYSDYLTGQEVEIPRKSEKPDPRGKFFCKTHGDGPDDMAVSGYHTVRIFPPSMIKVSPVT
jgi:hypothetical protein